LGSGADALMLVLLDSNIIISAMLSLTSTPAQIVDQWRDGRFRLLTCPQQIDEIRAACRNAKFRDRLQPHYIGTMLNHLYGATVWQGPLPRRHEASDPTDSYLLNLMEAAQPEYAVTGDKRSGLLRLDTLGRTKILSATVFLTQVLHL
jgi:putative PIN family toxin of toxin-antitoxin system